MIDRFGFGCSFHIFSSYIRESVAMNVFIQSKGESIVINGDISVTVLDIFGDDVVLAIDAPSGWRSTKTNRTVQKMN